MSKHGDRVDLNDRTRMEAYSIFGPALINSLTRLLARHEEKKAMEQLERSLVRLVEETKVIAPDADAMKEFAIELIVSAVHEAGEHPDAKQDLEKIDDRRTEGRSEDPNTLEEQLQSGLEDSFPASDPPSVVSTAISGRTKDIVGTDEVLLRRQKEGSRRKGEKNAE